MHVANIIMRRRIINLHAGLLVKVRNKNDNTRTTKENTNIKFHVEKERNR